MGGDVSHGGIRIRNLLTVLLLVEVVRELLLLHELQVAHEHHWVDNHLNSRTIDHLVDRNRS